MSKKRDNLDNDQNPDSEGTAVLCSLDAFKVSQIWQPEVQQHNLPSCIAGEGWEAPARINEGDFRAT